MDFSEVRLPITEIGNRLPIEFLRKILRRVKAHYTQSSEDFQRNYDSLAIYLTFSREERRTIEKAFRKTFALSVNDETTSTPVKVFPDMILYDFHRSSEVASSVLKIWVESQQELDSAVRTFLTKEDIPIEEAFGRLNGFVGDFSLELIAKIEGFQEQHAKYSIDDITLMFSCLTGHIPAGTRGGLKINELVSADQGQVSDSNIYPVSEIDLKEEENYSAGNDNNSTNLEGTKWNELLATIKSLGPEVANWDRGPLFLQLAQEIISNKLIERDQSGVRLVEVLTSLTTAFPEDLAAYAGELKNYASWENWDPGLCPPDEVLVFVSAVERLHSAFQESDELRTRLAGKGIPPTEQGRLRDRLGELYSEIGPLYKSVAARLGDFRDGALEPSDPEPHDFECAQETKQGIESYEKEELLPTPGSGTEEHAEVRLLPDLEIAPDPELNLEPAPTRQPELESYTGTSTSLYAFPQHSTSNEIASAIGGDNEDSFPLLRDLVWRLLYERKLDFALPISHIMQTRYAERPLWLPPWLLNALALDPHILLSDGKVEWFISKALKEFDAQKLFLTGEKEWNQAARLLAAAACARSALVAPSTNAKSVLLQLEFTRLPHLFEYCQLVGRAKSQVLDVHSLKGIKEFVSWKTNVDRLREKAQAWLKNASAFRLGSSFVLRVWQHWLKEGFINRLLQPVLDGIPNKLPNVEQLLKQYANEKEIKRELQRTDRVVLARPTSQFKEIDLQSNDVGNLVTHTNEALALAKGWVDLQKSRPPDCISYLQRQAEELGGKLLEHRQQITQEFGNYEQATSSMLLRTGLDYCRRSLESIWTLFDPQFAVPATEPDPNILMNGGILRIPSLMLDDEWRVESADDERVLTEILRAVADSRNTWKGAFEVHLQRGDHLSSQRIIEYLRITPESQNSLNLTNLSHARDKSLREWRDTLRHKAEETRRKVERAGVNDWLTEDETDNHLKRIRRILDSLDQTLLFTEEFRQLDAIDEDIERNLRFEKERAQARLERSGFQDSTPGYGDVCRALEVNDFRTANEYIDILNDKAELPQKEDDYDHLSQFFPTVAREFKKLDRTRKHELPDKVRRREVVCGIDFRQLTEDQAAKSSEMISRWFAIKSKGAIVPDDVAKVFKDLGFGGTIVTTGENYGKRRWFTARSNTIRDRKLCSVPAYGSGARGNYQILCVFDEPMEEELFTAVGDTLHRPVIVLYFGLIPDQERREMARLCRSNEPPRTFIIIDDALLLYLSSTPVGRLGVLFECALPFTWVEPYTPVGRVPFETFYGRASEKSAIQDPNGPCFVYGGKRLGKTALLSQVVDEFNNPEKGRIAILIDLKEAGVGYDLPVDNLWRLIAGRLQGKDSEDSRLKDLRIFPTQMTTKTGEDTLIKHIETWLREDSTRRILLLLDEADNFLERDGEEKTKEGKEVEFIRVHRLMKLWERTNGRFKVIFAGLHNVLRTTNVAVKVNPSIRHFGEPDDASLCIGPLLGKERKEAFQLIRRPLHALGYRFESSDLVLRILSHTNWYPSLIQLYCHHLIRHLRQSHTPIYDPKHSPPYVITSKNIDDAYRKVLYNQLKDRFHLTLQLDSRYKVIAYSIAHFLLSDRKIDAVGSLTVEEIQREALKWWGEGFRETASVTEESFRALLEEMRGLGVVRTNGEGHYTLRSVNIFAILGRAKEIGKVLKGKHQLPTKYEQATFRSGYPTGGNGPNLAGRRSPLTAQQIAELQANKNGVSIIFGTPSAGMDYLTDFLGAAFGERNTLQVPSAKDDESFEQQLRGLLAKRNNEGSTLIAVSPDRPWNHRWVGQALKEVQALTSRTSLVRVVFVADPTKTWQVLRHSATELFSLATKGMTTFRLTPWHDAAVSHWLEDCFDLQISEYDRDWIKEVSGNWPILLDEFRQIESKSPDLASSISSFAGLLEDVSYSREVFAAFGLSVQEPVELLKIMSDYKDPISMEELLSLTELSEDVISSCLRWAELLMLITPGERGLLHLDPVVNRVLQLASRETA